MSIIQKYKPSFIAKLKKINKIKSRTCIMFDEEYNVYDYNDPITIDEKIFSFVLSSFYYHYSKAKCYFVEEYDMAFSIRIGYEFMFDSNAAPLCIILFTLFHDESEEIIPDFLSKIKTMYDTINTEENNNAINHARDELPFNSIKKIFFVKFSITDVEDFNFQTLEEVREQYQDYINFLNDYEEEEDEPLPELIKTIREDTCVICMDAIPNIIYTTCNHIFICEKCYLLYPLQDRAKCAICRAKSYKNLKI